MHRFLASRSLGFCVFMLWLLPCNSQSPFNLVPNYSFETHSTCNANSLSNAYPWKAPTTSTGGNMADYLNSCISSSCCSVPSNIFGYGYQYARTGNAYALAYFLYQKGSNTNRGYLQTEIRDTLRAGHCYYAEFFVNLINSSSYAVNNVSLLFSRDPVTQGNTFQPIVDSPQIARYNNPILPVDTLNWIKISGVFIAKGGERYITIGNFQDDAHTDTIHTNIAGAYRYGEYNVDDVSVIPLDSFQLKADAGPDTTITLGDSIFIGSLTNGITNIHWYNVSGQLIDSIRPGFYVAPTASTFYIVEQTVCGQYSRDTVNITVNLLPLKLLSFSATPIRSPFWGVGGLLQWQTASEQNVSRFNIQRSYNGRSFITIGDLHANNRALNEYSFIDESSDLLKQTRWFYRIETVDNDGKRTYSPIKAVSLGEDNSSVTVYPNPSSTGLITVAFKDQTTAPKTISVTDLYGRVILRREGVTDQTTLLNLEGAKGMYFLKINDAATVKTETIKVIFN